MSRHEAKEKAPRILVVGAGRFGRHHIHTWQELEKDGLATLAGVVVRREASRAALEQEFGVPVWTNLEPDVLATADAADIVTPTETHAEVTRLLLPHMPVLVEKPTATMMDEAEKIVEFAAQQPHPLMVNHVYRFHPVTTGLQQLLREMEGEHTLIEGSFTNADGPELSGERTNLELLHYFDLLEQLLGRQSRNYWAEGEGEGRKLFLRFDGNVAAQLRLSVRSSSRERVLRFQTNSRLVIADFDKFTIDVFTENSRDKFIYDPNDRPLKRSFRHFLRVIAGEEATYPDAAAGAQAVSAALRSIPGLRKERERVLVIGGGVFGASSALELAEYADVTIAERHSELLLEASTQNQWRHHSGFHYPRSPETIREVKETRHEFDELYGDTVRWNVPCYYATAITAKEITADRYLRFCQANQLNFEEKLPPDGVIDPRMVGLSLLTDEGVIDIPKLRSRMRKKLEAHPSIDLRLRTEVTNAEIRKDGSKLIRYRREGENERSEIYDFVVNATYVNYNRLARWMGLPVRRMRFDYCELVNVQLPIDDVCVTILDGPFMFFNDTATTEIYTYYQYHQGFLQSRITSDGLPPQWRNTPDNRHNQIAASLPFYPILREAKILDTWVGIRGILVAPEDPDGRPTVIQNHGFGCWSVMGGKIGTCVSNAREITGSIFPGAAEDFASRRRVVASV